MICVIFIVYHQTSVIESDMGNHYHRNAKQAGAVGRNYPLRQPHSCSML